MMTQMQYFTLNFQQRSCRSFYDPKQFQEIRRAKEVSVGHHTIWCLEKDYHMDRHSKVDYKSWCTNV